ncbi:hypothetical protein H6P81_008326 [Aristolochia fimbriata]|uniref:Uncharacterized protein n=1 Tax=Aristolochia fimbriata TaxID=158543 RepID=A0AAV7F2V8_ARIFI|nr:hypothetical protein H6P81_008326 [Aristolochia fimbriata]
MGKLLETSLLGPLQPLSWPQEAQEAAPCDSEEVLYDWEFVSGLHTPQKRALKNLTARGVFWKHASKPITEMFLLFHGGDVGADGNCLFSAANRTLNLNKGSSSDLRKRVVNRFSEDYEAGIFPKEETDAAIRNLYSPDLELGWGVHFVQEIKLLALKSDRPGYDTSIEELVLAGLSREAAAESIYKEKCLQVVNGNTWAKYMSVAGNPDDEYDIVSLHYTEEGLLSVDENRNGKAAAFGDDIAIEALATEFQREIFVVQAHGSDASSDEDGTLFFLPHRPRGQILEPPIFLLMRGTDWCGAGADHYEPLIARPAPPVVSKEKAVVIL